MEPALERNFRFYESKQSELVASANGKFVLIRDEQLIGIFPTEDEAMTAGYQRFGAGPFFVHRIAEEDPIVASASHFIVP